MRNWESAINGERVISRNKLLLKGEENDIFWQIEQQKSNLIVNITAPFVPLGCRKKELGLMEYSSKSYLAFKNTGYARWAGGSNTFSQKWK